MTRAAVKASEAAEALLAWLDRQSPRPIAGFNSPRTISPAMIVSASAGAIGVGAGPNPVCRHRRRGETGKTAGQGRQRGESPDRGDADLASGGKRLAHPDWLAHRLTITGPAVELVAFRQAAAGAGSIPWQLDFDRLEEDFFLRLAAPPPPQARTLSLDGARILAEQLRAAVAQRHALAVARVGHSKACPFDLHALLPVPGEILGRGPDDPAVHRLAVDALGHAGGAAPRRRHHATRWRGSAGRRPAGAQFLVGGLVALAGAAAAPPAMAGAAVRFVPALRAGMTATIETADPAISPAAIAAWEFSPRPIAETAPMLTVDGFAGPLDWLLELVRTGKIDLTRLSIVALIDAFATALDAALAGGKTNRKCRWRAGATGW